MSAQPDVTEVLQSINAKSGFNRWAQLEVSRADDAGAEIRLPWREELGQYSGFLHAGVVGALIDTVCGFAAVAATGRPVLASHYSVSFLSPAVGTAFVAKGKVIKAGKRQVFTAAEVYAETGGRFKMVATGETLLMVAEGSLYS